jgi:hypothetical protein
MRADSIAGEAVLDFMFWPGGKHKLQGLGYNALFRIRLQGAISISAIDLCRTRTKAD